MAGVSIGSQGWEQDPSQQDLDDDDDDDDAIPSLGFRGNEEIRAFFGSPEELDTNCTNHWRSSVGGGCSSKPSHSEFPRGISQLWLRIQRKNLPVVIKGIFFPSL